VTSTAIHITCRGHLADLQAQADAGWLQREQHRRELALTLQRDKLRAAEEEAKARLGQTAAQVGEKLLAECLLH
jgi:hypothetical protein